MNETRFGQQQFAYKAMLQRRLARLERMRKDYEGDLNPLGLRLLDRSIAATVSDLESWPDEAQP